MVVVDGLIWGAKCNRALGYSSIFFKTENHNPIVRLTYNKLDTNF